MVDTHGLTHISLAVADPRRSMDFYSRVFGVREYFRDEQQIQGQGPGAHDIMAFVRDPERAGTRAGIDHFGFRLKDARDIDRAIDEVLQAGGKLLRRGEFRPGLPYAYVADPDGYELEIWFE
jgi:catechol 2,3-dioxygenase-like lactoylglutathione lyase family enzyme